MDKFISHEVYKKIAYAVLERALTDLLKERGEDALNFIKSNQCRIYCEVVGFGYEAFRDYVIKHKDIKMGSNDKYPINLKLDIVKRSKAYEGSLKNFAELVGIPKRTILQWRKDYKEGKLKEIV